jgi:tight adherence protein C
MSAAAVLLGAAWGVVVAAPLGAVARRASTVERARGLRTVEPPVRRLVSAAKARVPAALRRVVEPVRLRRARRRRRAVIAGELPVAVDLLGVAVGAGCTPFLAIGAAAEWAPPETAAALRSVLRAHAMGASLDDALRDVGAREGVLRALTDTLRDAGRLGVPLRPALSRLAAEQRAELRRAAEVHARRVPVRLLFPLVFLVLPAFGLLTVAPALLAGVGAR